MIRIHFAVGLFTGFLACWSLGISASAQAVTPSDTLRFSLPQLEQQFLTQNYQLLAQRYQIDISGAAITQAGLRPNPNLWFQTNFYNPNTNKILPLATPSQADQAAGNFNSGYVALQVQQLILLAGKRSKLVALAESNRTLAQLVFRDVLRNLRYLLYSTYANLFYDLQAQDLLRQEERRQLRLIESTKVALQTGGVAPYDLTRLEAALQDLRANIANYRGQIADEQASLRVLLRQTGEPFLLPIGLPNRSTALPALATALDSALTNRPDNALAQEQINNARRSLTLEKARKTPDLTAGLLYERYGNAYTNFIGMQFSMDLPVRFRNQGNIRAAEMTLKSVSAGQENQVAVVQSDVLNAYEKLGAFYEQNLGNPVNYRSRLQNISEEATRNYNSRVIGLLDYLDKIRTAQSAQLNLINLQNNLFNAQEQLNFVTNTRFF